MSGAPEPRPPWWNPDILPSLFGSSEKRRAHWADRAKRCHRCWYDLSAIESDRCPECGTARVPPGDFWRDGRIPLKWCLAINIVGILVAAIYAIVVGIAVDLLIERRVPFAIGFAVALSIVVAVIVALVGVPFLNMWRVRSERSSALRYLAGNVATWSALIAIIQAVRWIMR